MILYLYNDWQTGRSFVVESLPSLCEPVLPLNHCDIIIKNRFHGFMQKLILKNYFFIMKKLFF